MVSVLAGRSLCRGQLWELAVLFGGWSNRHFPSISQMKRYDHYYDDAPAGSYVQTWVPELCGGSNDNREVLFRPWDFNIPGFEDPIADPKSQYTWQDAQRLEETGMRLTLNYKLSREMEVQFGCRKTKIEIS